MVYSGFLKVACPYGVIIAGTETYPDSYINYASNLVANLIDPDWEGTHNEERRKNFSAFGLGMAAGGLDEQSEGGGCDSIESWTNNAWESCHGLQTYKVTEADVPHRNEKELDENFQAQIKKVMTEEIVHMY